MRRTYRRPPIQEAICDIRFTASDVWDVFSPGRVYSELRDKYEEEARQVTSSGLEIIQDDGATSFRLREEDARTELATQGRRRLIRFGPSALSVHILSPYTGWEDFQSRIETAYGAYVRAAEPKAVRRVAIRYINRMEFKETELNLSEYFANPPDLPEVLDFAVSSFLMRLETFRNDGTRLIETFASAPSPPGLAAIILDLDVIREWEDANPPLADCLKHVAEVREIERVAFEALITEKARETFDAG
jgi:uncharacterized protein (TIGR04255 family)